MLHKLPTSWLSRCLTSTLSAPLTVSALAVSTASPLSTAASQHRVALSANRQLMAPSDLLSAVCMPLSCVKSSIFPQTLLRPCRLPLRLVIRRLACGYRAFNACRVNRPLPTPSVDPTAPLPFPKRRDFRDPHWRRKLRRQVHRERSRCCYESHTAAFGRLVTCTSAQIGCLCR